MAIKVIALNLTPKVRCYLVLVNFFLFSLLTSSPLQPTPRSVIQPWETSWRSQMVQPPSTSSSSFSHVGFSPSTHTRTHTHTHAHAHTNTHTHVRTHTCTHMHTHEHTLQPPLTPSSYSLVCPLKHPVTSADIRVELRVSWGLSFIAIKSIFIISI